MACSPQIFPESLERTRKMYDISVPPGHAPSYPGDRIYQQEWMARLDGEDGYCLSALSLSSHAATHLDFPSHLLRSGKSQSDYSPDRFIIPADVIPISGNGPVHPSSLKGCRIAKGQAILFKTENSGRGLMHQPSFSSDYIFLSAEAARLCASCGAGLVGIDYLSVDRFDDKSLSAHRILLESDVLILEGLDLSRVPGGRYLLVCLPLSIENAEASPVRAVLLG